MVVCGGLVPHGEIHNESYKGLQSMAPPGKAETQQNKEQPEPCILGAAVMGHASIISTRTNALVKLGGGQPSSLGRHVYACPAEICDSATRAQRMQPSIVHMCGYAAAVECIGTEVFQHRCDI